jgi:dTDP-4-dehydrorhamnose reductase
VEERIAIVGSKGMLGSDLVIELSRSFDIIPLAKQDLDITEAEACRKAAESLKAAVIVNASGFTDVDGCESRRDEAMLLNSTAVANLAEACRAVGTMLVHFSTDYVFDGASSRPYREEDAPNPLSFYGLSKRRGEQAVMNALDRYIIIRTSWLFGKAGKNFVDTILKLAKQQKTLKVVTDQRGAPTYTRDLAQAVGALLQKKAVGLFHVTNSGSCTWYEFAREIIQYAYGGAVDVLPTDSSSLGRPARRPAYSVLDNEKFNRVTGMHMRPWPEALHEYLKECSI